MISFGGQQLVLLLEINWQIFHIFFTASGKARLAEDSYLNAGHFRGNISRSLQWHLIQKNERSKFQEQVVGPC